MAEAQGRRVTVVIRQLGLRFSAVVPGQLEQAFVEGDGGGSAAAAAGRSWSGVAEEVEGEAGGAHVEGLYERHAWGRVSGGWVWSGDMGGDKPIVFW